MTDVRVTTHGSFAVGGRGGVARDIRVTSFGVYVISRRVDNVTSESVDTGHSGVGLAIPSFLLNNWTGKVEMATEWSTDVVPAISLSEDRRSLLDRPYRTQTVRLTGMDRATSQQIMQSLQRHARQRMAVPIFSDMLLTTAVSGSATLFCNPEYRRFSVGGTVLVNNQFITGPNSLQYRVVKEILPDRLILESNLQTSIPEGSRAFPVMSAELQLSSNPVFITDENVQVDFKALEAVGPGAIDVSYIDVPDFAYRDQDGRPIFDLPPDWGGKINKSPQQEGKVTKSGRGVIISQAGPRPLVNYDLSFDQLERWRYWRILQFFDHSRGRGKTFWYVSPENLFKIVARAQGAIRIQQDVPAERDIEDFLPYVAIVLKNGEIEIHEVADVLDDGTWVLVLGSIAGNYLDEEIDRITSANLVRFSKDALVENWVTQEVVKLSLAFKEVIEEKDVEIENIPEVYSIIPPQALPIHIDPTHWHQASQHCYKQLADPMRLFRSVNNLDKVSIWDDVRLSPSPARWVHATGVDVNQSLLVSSGTVSFLDRPILGGRPAIKTSATSDRFFFLNGGAKLWRNGVGGAGDENGLTIVVAINTMIDAPVQLLFKATAGSHTGVSINWTDERLDVLDDFGGTTYSIDYSPVPASIRDRDMIWILSWRPGNFLRVWRSFSGDTAVQLGQAIGVPNDIIGDEYLYECDYADTHVGTFLVWPKWIDFTDVVTYLKDTYNMDSTLP